MLKSIFILIRKDLSIELRSKEVLVLLLGLSVLLALIGAFGITSASLNPATTQRIFPGILWMIFLFSATVSLGRSFEQELEYSAIDGLLLTGISPSAIYVAKVLGNFVLTLASHSVSLVLLAGFCDVDIWLTLGEILVCSAFVIFAFSSLTTLLIAPTSTSRLRGFLLPLILLPLAFPLLLSALETTNQILSHRFIDWSSAWISLVLVLDIAYFLLGLNLYEHVIRE